MSGGTKCQCDSAYFEVTQRQCNHSAFNGYQWTASKYSEVHCRKCGRYWRTKARYVKKLPDAIKESKS